MYNLNLILLSSLYCLSVNPLSLSYNPNLPLFVSFFAKHALNKLIHLPLLSIESEMNRATRTRILPLSLHLWSFYLILIWCNFGCLWLLSEASGTKITLSC